MKPTQDDDNDKYEKVRRQRSNFRRKVAIILSLPIVILIFYGYHYFKNTSSTVDISEHTEESSEDESENDGEPPQQIGKDAAVLSGSSPELYLPPLEPGEVMRIFRNDDSETPISEYGCRVGLPPQLRREILAYCDEVGMIDRIRKLLENPLDSDEMKVFEMGSDHWNAHRPPTHTWNSNMHWVEPYDDSTNQNFLKVLGRGGFDEVLDSMGKFFDLDGIYIFSISIISVSNAYGQSYLHHDFINTGGKGFNVIIPLISVENSPPELFVQDETTDYETLYAIKYNDETAVVTADSFYHKTSPVDYDITKGEMRISATIYFGDINEDNIEEFVGDSTPIEPEDTRETLLEKSGSHWSPQGNRLPR